MNGSEWKKQVEAGQVFVTQEKSFYNREKERIPLNVGCIPATDTMSSVKGSAVKVGFR